MYSSFNPPELSSLTQEDILQFYRALLSPQETPKGSVVNTLSKFREGFMTYLKHMARNEDKFEDRRKNILIVQISLLKAYAVFSAVEKSAEKILLDIQKGEGLQLRALLINDQEDLIYSLESLTEEVLSKKIPSAAVPKEWKSGMWKGELACANPITPEEYQERFFAMARWLARKKYKEAHAIHQRAKQSFNEELSFQAIVLFKEAVDKMNSFVSFLPEDINEKSSYELSVVESIINYAGIRIHHIETANPALTTEIVNILNIGLAKLNGIDPAVIDDEERVKKSLTAFQSNLVAILHQSAMYYFKNKNYVEAIKVQQSCIAAKSEIAHEENKTLKFYQRRLISFYDTWAIECRQKQLFEEAIFHHQAAMNVYAEFAEICLCDKDESLRDFAATCMDYVAYLEKNNHDLPKSIAQSEYAIKLLNQLDFKTSADMEQLEICNHRVIYLQDVLQENEIERRLSI